MGVRKRKPVNPSKLGAWVAKTGGQALGKAALVLTLTSLLVLFQFMSPGSVWADSTSTLTPLAKPGTPPSLEDLSEVFKKLQAGIEDNITVNPKRDGNAIHLADMHRSLKNDPVKAQSNEKEQQIELAQKGLLKGANGNQLKYMPIDKNGELLKAIVKNDGTIEYFDNNKNPGTPDTTSPRFVDPIKDQQRLDLAKNGRLTDKNGNKITYSPTDINGLELRYEKGDSLNGEKERFFDNNNNEVNSDQVKDRLLDYKNSVLPVSDAVEVSQPNSARKVASLKTTGIVKPTGMIEVFLKTLLSKGEIQAAIEKKQLNDQTIKENKALQNIAKTKKEKDDYQVKIDAATKDNENQKISIKNSSDVVQGKLNGNIDKVAGEVDALQKEKKILDEQQGKLNQERAKLKAEEGNISESNYKNLKKKLEIRQEELDRNQERLDAKFDAKVNELSKYQDKLRATKVDLAKMDMLTDEKGNKLEYAPTDKKGRPLERILVNDSSGVTEKFKDMSNNEVDSRDVVHKIIDPITKKEVPLGTSNESTARSNPEVRKQSGMAQRNRASTDTTNDSFAKQLKGNYQALASRDYQLNPINDFPPASDQVLAEKTKGINGDALNKWTQNEEVYKQAKINVDATKIVQLDADRDQVRQTILADRDLSLRNLQESQDRLSAMNSEIQKGASKEISVVKNGLSNSSLSEMLDKKSKNVPAAADSSQNAYESVTLKGVDDKGNETSKKAWANKGELVDGSYEKAAEAKNIKVETNSNGVTTKAAGSTGALQFSKVTTDSQGNVKGGLPLNKDGSVITNGEPSSGGTRSIPNGQRVADAVEAEKAAPYEGYRSKVSNGDDCHVSAQINGKYSCSGTNKISQGVQMGSQMAQMAGGIATQGMGTAAQKQAITSTSQQEMMENAAKLQMDTVEYIQTPTAALNIVGGLYMAKRAYNHSSNANRMSAELAEDQVYEGSSGSENTKLMGRSEMANEAIEGFELEGQSAATAKAEFRKIKSDAILEQKKVAAEAGTVGFMTTMQGMQMGAAAGVNYAAAQAELDLAHKYNAGGTQAPPPTLTMPTSDMNGGGNTGGGGAGSQAISGDGTNPNAVAATSTETGAGIGPPSLGTGFDPNPSPSGLGSGEAPGAFNSGLADSSGGGGGGDMGGGGDTSAASDQPTQGAMMVGNPEGQSYASAGGAAGGGVGMSGGGGKGGGGESAAGMDLNSLLAGFLPKKDDPAIQGKNIMQFGNQGADAMGPVSMFDKNVNIFERVHETYQDKHRKGLIN